MTNQTTETNQTTYRISVPLTTYMQIDVDGQKGLKFQEIVDSVSRDDIATALVDYDFHDMRDAFIEGTEGCDVDTRTYIEDIDNDVEVPCEREVLNY